VTTFFSEEEFEKHCDAMLDEKLATANQFACVTADLRASSTRRERSTLIAGRTTASSRSRPTR